MKPSAPPCSPDREAPTADAGRKPDAPQYSGMERAQGIIAVIVLLGVACTAIAAVLETEDLSFRYMTEWLYRHILEIVGVGIIFLGVHVFNGVLKERHPWLYKVWDLFLTGVALYLIGGWLLSQ